MICNTLETKIHYYYKIIKIFVTLFILYISTLYIFYKNFLEIF